MADLTLFNNYLPNKSIVNGIVSKNYNFTIDVTLELLATYKISDYFSLTFSGYLIYDDDIKIPRYEKDGITPVFLSRPEGQLDPITNDNHYFFDYADPEAYNHNTQYVENDNGDEYIDPGEYWGYKIVKTGPALQFMEYWMFGLSFTF
jgi:hypothetical protein